MKNIKLTISYDGTRYKGWQRLNGVENTIQQKIETVLSRMTGETIEIYGAGRTDAGAHALAQIANFKTKTILPLYDILAYCYEYLPEDIVIKSAEEVDHRFHARYLAKRKIYLYKIRNARFHDVFERKYSYHVHQSLSVESMRRAATLLEGEHDFTSFTSLKSKNKSMVREIHQIDIRQKDENIEIYFEGNGFLYNMVRIIAGTLIEVGLKKLDPESMKDLLAEKSRPLSGPTAPAQGLFLVKVIY